jgi:hypothetical protein
MQTASKHNPAIKGRFLFFAGNPSSDDLFFFYTNGLRYLPKPSSVKIIRQAVQAILQGSSGVSMASSHGSDYPPIAP